jgi:uncharacterized protein (TIGR00730 family)
MQNNKRYAVFCGSCDGKSPDYAEQAYLLGKTLANKNIQLVFGGGNVGLMQKVANGCMDNNGYSIGVIPRFLVQREVAHKGVTELVIVETMHERKKIMFELADGFIILPGGFGTLDELFELLTLKKLGLLNKPIAILNTNDFYKPLQNLIQQLQDDGFIPDNQQPIVSSEMDSMFAQIEKVDCKLA